LGGEIERAAASLLKSADGLRDAGRAAETSTAYDAIVLAFRSLPAAEQAKKRLRELGKATTEGRNAEKADRLFESTMNLVRAEWRRRNAAKGSGTTTINPVAVLKEMPRGPQKDRIIDALTLLSKAYGQTTSGKKADIIVGSL